MSLYSFHKENHFIFFFYSFSYLTVSITTTVRIGCLKKKTDERGSPNTKSNNTTHGVEYLRQGDNTWASYLSPVMCKQFNNSLKCFFKRKGRKCKHLFNSLKIMKAPPEINGYIKGLALSRRGDLSMKYTSSNTNL